MNEELTKEQMQQAAKDAAGHAKRVADDFETLCKRHGLKGAVIACIAVEAVTDQKEGLCMFATHYQADPNEKAVAFTIRNMRGAIQEVMKHCAATLAAAVGAMHHMTASADTSVKN